MQRNQLGSGYFSLASQKTVVVVFGWVQVPLQVMFGRVQVLLQVTFERVLVLLQTSFGRVEVLLQVMFGGGAGAAPGDV